MRPTWNSAVLLRLRFSSSPVVLIPTALPITLATPEKSTAAAESCNLTALGIIDAIFAGLDHFNRTLFDEQTLIALKVK
jgi:hypothetical protein